MVFVVLISCLTSVSKGAVIVLNVTSGFFYFDYETYPSCITFNSVHESTDRTSRTRFIVVKTYYVTREKPPPPRVSPGALLMVSVM